MQDSYMEKLMLVFQGILKLPLIVALLHAGVV